MKPVADADVHAAPKEPLSFEAFLRQRVSVFAVRFKHSPTPTLPAGGEGAAAPPLSAGEVGRGHVEKPTQRHL